MSYIKVLIGGKERWLKFNTLAVRQFLTKLDFDNFSLTANYAMVWGGLYANCYVKSEEVDFAFEDVIDWVDELNQNVIDEISKVMASVEAYKKLLPAEPVVEDEKKSQSVST